MTKLTVLATNYTAMVAISEVSGKITSNMEKGSNDGPMAQCLKEPTLTVRSKAMVLLPGPMAIATRATSNKTE